MFLSISETLNITFPNTPPKREQDSLYPGLESYLFLTLETMKRK